MSKDQGEFDFSVPDPFKAYWTVGHIQTFFFGKFL